MRIWISGCGGFMGSYLVDALRAKGHIVDGNDNESGNSVKVSPLQRHDCCNFKIIKNLMIGHKTDVLIHTAALAHEGLSNFSPSFITKNIYEASVSMFSAAIAAGVKRIIFMSSMARYGEQSLPFHEVQTPMPLDPYGVAKVAAEDTLRVLAKTHGIEHVILVPHSIIGARQNYWDSYRNVASIMINRALQEKPIYVYGDGKQTRSFSPIEDCLDSIIKTIDGPFDGEIINIGPDGNEISILELAKMVADKCSKYTNHTPEIIHLEKRPNEVRNAYCSSKKAKKLLGYKPLKDIGVCLDEMIKYVFENGTKSFTYHLPIEIEKGLPLVWKDRML